MERALGDELDGLLVVGPGRGHRCCDRCGGGLRAGRAALAVGRDRAGGRGWRLLEVLVSGEWRLPALPRSAHVVCGLKNMLLSATHLDAAVLAVPKDTAFHAAFGLSSGFFGPGPVRTLSLDASQSSPGEKSRGGDISRPGFCHQLLHWTMVGTCRTQRNTGGSITRRTRGSD